MPLKTLLYLGALLFSLAASVIYHPIIGVYAYLFTYNINPSGQWWGSLLPAGFERYSFLLAIAIALGIVVKWSVLSYRRFFEKQEQLLLLLLGIIWFAAAMDGQIDYNVMKMTKVIFILLMASHIVTSMRFFEGLLWVFILSGLSLGYDIFTGAGEFRGGRLNTGVGGSDFGESNFLALHFSFIVPFVGVMLLKGSKKAKVTCVISAAFILNSVVLTRSRGAFLAIAVGVVLALFSLSRLGRYRKAAVVILLLGMVGGITLTDSRFWGRIHTISVEDAEERDSSAQQRIEAWTGAWAMAKAHPMGVGVGNFHDRIGFYKPMMAGMDAHNTYLRCLAELGFPGLFVLLWLIKTSFATLKHVDSMADQLLPEERTEDVKLYSHAVRCALVIYLVGATFISCVYIEEFYWVLMLPVFLFRAVENELPTANIPLELSAS
ncbi:O-antigen ligase family protein [Trichloromonas sp.]|uniref:O-antigen ligase family protein n=1 Tax=Trichloromonas sp. TaxID=3069249 RepID=UPI003D81B9BA